MLGNLGAVEDLNSCELFRIRDYSASGIRSIELKHAPIESPDQCLLNNLGEVKRSEGSVHLKIAKVLFEERRIRF